MTEKCYKEYNYIMLLLMIMIGYTFTYVTGFAKIWNNPARTELNYVLT